MPFRTDANRRFFLGRFEFPSQNNQRTKIFSDDGEFVALDIRAILIIYFGINLFESKAIHIGISTIKRCDKKSHLFRRSKAAEKV